MNKSNLISITGQNEITIISFKCDLDVAIVPDLRQQINNEINEKSHSYIIDLSDVPFVDSHGIGLFASLLKKAYANKGQLAFVGVNGQPKSILHLVGFNDNLVKYYIGINEAIADLSS